jgi:hypothetical protein
LKKRVLALFFDHYCGSVAKAVLCTPPTCVELDANLAHLVHWRQIRPELGAWWQRQATSRRRTFRRSAGRHDAALNN